MRANSFEDLGLIARHFDHQGRLGKPLGKGKGGNLFFGIWASFQPLQGRTLLGIYPPPQIPVCLPHYKAGIVLERWLQGLSVMLEKIFGCALITEL